MFSSKEPHLLKDPPFGKLCLWLTGMVLLTAALITSAIGHTAAPRSMPDERHHYAVIKYIADHFGQFPLDYSAIRTDTKADPNHLIHPPMYHYLMAASYLLFHPDRHFTWAGKDYDINGSAATSAAIIPMLRGISLFWILLGLLGTFLLLKDCLRRGFLSPLSCVLCAAMISFFASFLYIGGGLSNDVLGLAIWPWLTLATIGYLLDRSAKAFWLAWCLLAALLLTKASFWMMVLGLGTLLGIRAAFDLKSNGFHELVDRHRRNWPAWIFAVCAISLWCLGLLHLNRQWQQYGLLQPNYETVFQIPDRDSKFLVANSIQEIHPRSHYEIAHLCIKRLIRSFRSSQSHLERISDPYAGLIFPVSCLALFFILAGSIPFWRDRTVHPWLKILTGALLVLPGLNLALLLQINFSFYERTQNLAVEGRYFAGYIHMFIFALFILTTHVWQQFKSRKASSFLVLLGLIILGSFYIRPFQFFKKSHEIFYQAQMVKIIPEKLRQDGFSELQLVPEHKNLKPYRHLKWYARVKDYYPVFSPEDELAFHIPSTYHDWELLVWVETPGSPSPPRTMTIRKTGQKADHAGSLQIALTPNMDLLKTTIPASQDGAGSHWLLCTSAPNSKLAKWLPKSLKPQFGPVKIFGVFIRPVPLSNGPEMVKNRIDQGPPLTFDENGFQSNR